MDPANGHPPHDGHDDPSPTPSSPRAERLAALLIKSRALPKVPGVYLMKDAAGIVIYVGKALRLPDRVSSYFLPSTNLGPNKQPMLELVCDFDIVECESEWEALLAENRLIKDIRPRYNAMLTDDKTFPYLAITLREDFPRIAITRKPADPEFSGSRIFGPFTAAGALREAMALLQRIFKFRTCSLDIMSGDPKLKQFRPCLLYNINQCTAPCAAKIDREPYRADIDRFIRFLESKRSVMLREMRAEMAAASSTLDFEKAATIRDQIRALEKLNDRSTRSAQWQPEAESFYLDPKRGLRSLQKTLSMDQPIRCIEAIDIAHLQGGETVGSKVCFVDGRPLKNEYRRYRIKSAGHGPSFPVADSDAPSPAAGGGGGRVFEAGGGSAPIDDYASIREVVSRRYREAGAGQELYPDIILIDGGLGQLHAALEAFTQLNIKPPMVISLAKKEELIYIQQKTEPIRLSRDNAGLRLCQSIRDEAHRFAQHYHHILRRKKTLEEE